MREIKFRAYSTHLKKYVKIDGRYKSNENGIIIINGGMDVILEQYIGLKDKNGVEIYEGDMVELDLGHLGKTDGFVVWHKEKARFYYDNKIIDQLVFKSDYTKYTKVIGNIHTKGDRK